MAPKRKTKTGRREKGTGSIWQNKDGSYTVALNIGGDYIRRRAPDRPGAEERLRELQDLKRQQIRVRDGAQSLEDFLNVWFQDVALESGIKPRTAEDYKDRIELHILPRLGTTRLDALEPALLQRFVNEVQREVSADAARKAFGILHRALQIARQWRYIALDPCDGVILPKVRRQQKRPLTVEEARALLAAVENTRFCAAYHVALTFGLRLGELLGLRWVDLDWEQAEIKVTQQVQLVNDRVVIAEPKSEASSRTLPIPPMLLSRLRSHWAAQQAERLHRGPKWHEHGLIFPSERGTPKSPRNFTREYYVYRERAGLSKDLNFHLLRHTVATLLDEVGASETIRAGILGHAKRTVTQRYTHARMAAMRRVLELVERELHEGQDAERAHA